METATASSFSHLIPELLNRRYLGIDIGQVTLIVLVLALAFLLRPLFAAIVMRQVRRVLKRSAATDVEHLVAALERPVRFMPIVIATLVIAEVLTVSDRLKLLLADVNRSLIAFVLAWMLFVIVEPVLASLNKRLATFGTATIGWMDRMAKILIVLVGAATILEIWGIKVGPVLAGLGLVGAAVALGAQDLFKNLISGVFIIAEQRFHTGDWIRADGIVEGTVDTIGLRTTKVIRFDLSPVYVPNSLLANNAVTNFSGMTYRQISWTVGLTYDTTTAQLKQVRDGIEAYILGAGDYVTDDPDNAPVFVRVDTFGDSAINLMVYCFTRTTDWAAWLKIKEELAFAISKIVADAGSSMAFPSQSLYVESLPPSAGLLAASATAAAAAPAGPATAPGASGRV